MFPNQAPPPAPAPPMPMAAPQQAPAPAPTNGAAQMFKNCLGRLSPEELQELDDYIDPRFQELMAKAFGPEVGQMLEPFVQDDQDQQDMDNQDQQDGSMSSGPEAIPYSNTPINQVKAMGYDDNEQNNARV